MSRQLINEYRADLDRLRAVSGSRRESVLREAFKDLLKRWGRAHDLLFVPEHAITTPQKNRIYLDGALLHALRVPFGYWEAKDADDDLDVEIAAKTRKGYPRDNIIYSDDHTAILIQDGHEVARVAMDDTDELYPLLVRFYAHERQEIADFNKAVKQFSLDLPAVLDALRDRIATTRSASKSFSSAEMAFLKHAQEAINPAVTEDDVQEMLIQHILTEDIFAKVFDNPDFHRQNNVASELYKLEEKLFARGEKSTLLRALSPYYSGIARTAAVIQTHSEKQGFLKGLYENFYKVYNAKAADRLGVVYTPGEIVRFMIRSTDWLCEKHFQKNLVDRGVEILDPATGTGTFIVELLEYFRGHHDKLRHKYKEELHANEVAILPYYVANLNIESTYQAITGQFAEFENLCFVDTLDNVDALGIHSGHQFDLLGSLTDENIERIKKQNRRKISVIIGNPPYNANQKNENENNKNRTYAHIDMRIKNTYLKASKARKTKLYDPYVRFFRWASDRLGDEGIIAFITNRSFVDALGYDGFRQSVGSHFAEGWVLDLGGDFKRNDEAGSGNVFGIGTGVAISFWVKSKTQSDRHVLKYRSTPRMDAEDKLSSLARVNFTDGWTNLLAGEADWVGIPTAETKDMLPMADAKTKAASQRSSERAIFKLYSLGISTNRDDWLYDRDAEHLIQKITFLSEVYDDLPRKPLSYPSNVKWSRNLKRRLAQGRHETVNKKLISEVEYRPFSTRLLYRSPLFVDELGQSGAIFPDESANMAIGIAKGRRGVFACLAMGKPPALDWFIPDACQYHSRYRYTKTGECIDNITDWALNKFVKEYGKKGVTKDAIFHYVYAVLHDPIYRDTYALNLKREIPRIPLNANFAQWATWGKMLMALHIGYDEVAPWPIKRIETAGKRAAGTTPKPILKSQAEAGVVVVDADTQISAIPPEAWTYRLGSRSAIDWVLDQHKEKKPRDPTIAAQFNDYRFADYKESMIELLAKVVSVSIETVNIITAMKEIDRSA